MQQSYPKYESYKDSGVAWLGKIPSDWSVEKAKRIFKDVSEKNYPNEELLSVTQDKGVIPRALLEQRVVMPTGQLQSFKLVRKDDFVISLRSFQGGLEYSEYTGIVSPAYTVLRKQKNINSGFLKHLLKSSNFISELNTTVTGIRQGKNIDFGELSYSFLPIPEENEQANIANFLDKKSAEIDEAIAKKEQLIVLIKEQKTIAINNAVTKGLNPDAPMKDSGIEWIGKIPEHWEVKKIKHVSKISPTKKLDDIKIKNSDKVVFLPMENIGVDGTIIQENLQEYKNVAEGFTYFAKGDVVVAKITPCFENGKGALLSELETNFGFGTTELHVLRAMKVNSEYLYLLVTSKDFRRLGEEFMTGSAGQKRVSTSFISNYFFGVPPKQEQIDIVNHCNEISTQAEAAIKSQQKQIKQLKEYKQTLIANVVTGKIKVA